MTYTLADLDAMSIEDAQALSFVERDALLDLIIQTGGTRPRTSTRTAWGCTGTTSTKT